MHARGVDLYLHQQGLDTTTRSSRAMYQMLGVFAEFERSMIRERVLAGMSRAAAKGTKSGKPIGRPRIGAALKADIRAALAKGDVGMRKIAVQFGVATGTVQRIAAAS
jgi:DNA invertase Pin-like site-specific DNA recombinase